MSHEKTIHDGKKSNPFKKLKEKRAEMKAKRAEKKARFAEETKHHRKPRRQRFKSTAS